MPAGNRNIGRENHGTDFSVGWRECPTSTTQYHVAVSFIASGLKSLYITINVSAPAAPPKSSSATQTPRPAPHVGGQQQGQIIFDAPTRTPNPQPPPPVAQQPPVQQQPPPSISFYADPPTINLVPPVEARESNKVPLPLPALELKTDRTTIQSGECVTLSWTGANVQNISLDGTPINNNPGSDKYCPLSTKTYILRATASSGDLSQSVTVNVLPAINFKVAPSSIYKGQCAVLTWLAVNADNTYLDGEKRAMYTSFGSREVCPKTTTTYEFKAVNSVGEKTQSVSVTVLGDLPSPPPESASDDKVLYGKDSIFKEGQCTWWAYKRRLENGHRIPIVLGEFGKWDAKNWANNAKELELPVDQNPAVGDIVVWTKETKTLNDEGNEVIISGDTGHVAYVEEVEVHYEIQDGKPVSTGYIIGISESNGGGNGRQGNKQRVWVTEGTQFIH
jgi:surface antigen